MDITTQILIRFIPDLISEDQYGNKYYRKKKSDERYVIFNGKEESSKILPMSYAWLQKIIIKPVVKRNKIYECQKKHFPDSTGTEFAVKPKGSLLDKGFRQKPVADFKLWKPKNNYEI